MSKMIVKRLGVLSIGKMNGIVCAALGLVIGVIYGLILMTVGAAMMTQDGAGGAGAVGIGLFAIVGFPIFYGVFGFIFGMIGALIYNLASGFVGGIEMELENAEGEYVAPPPPRQDWQPNNYNPNSYDSGQRPY